MQCEIFGLVDNSHAATAKFFNDAIVRNCLADHGREMKCYGLRRDKSIVWKSACPEAQLPVAAGSIKLHKRRKPPPQREKFSRISAPGGYSENSPSILDRKGAASKGCGACPPKYESRDRELRPWYHRCLRCCDS